MITSEIKIHLNSARIRESKQRQKSKNNSFFKIEICQKVLESLFNIATVIKNRAS